MDGDGNRPLLMTLADRSHPFGPPTVQQQTSPAVFAPAGNDRFQDSDLPGRARLWLIGSLRRFGPPILVGEYPQSLLSPGPLPPYQDSPLGQPLLGFRIGRGGPIISAQTQGGFPAGPVKPAPPPSPLKQNRGGNFIRRDPSQDRTTGTTIDKLVILINSLLSQGLITQTGPAAFTIKTTPLPFQVGRAPTVFDDSTKGVSVGQGWIDTAGQQAYIAISVAVNAAVWKRITQ